MVVEEGDGEGGVEDIFVMGLGARRLVIMGVRIGVGEVVDCTDGIIC